VIDETDERVVAIGKADVEEGGDENEEASTSPSREGT
jgi:hypothetical protein